MWRTPAACAEHAPVLLHLVRVVASGQEDRLDAVERGGERPLVVERADRDLGVAQVDGLAGQRADARDAREVADHLAADLSGRSGDEDHRGGASPGGLWRISRMTPARSAVS